MVNFKEEYQPIKSTKSHQMDLVLTEAANILLEINNEYLNIIYGRILKILSTYQRSDSK